MKLLNKKNIKQKIMLLKLFQYAIQSATAMLTIRSGGKLLWNKPTLSGNFIL